MRRSDNISIPGFKAPAGWNVKKSNFIKNPERIKLTAFRAPVELIEKIEEFADRLELKYLPVKGKGYKSLAIRLLIEDSLNRYMGPKNDPDELVCPFADEMSKILPVLKNIRLREKLDEMPDNTSHNKEEIDKIIKKYG
ncbi:hypothetical protein ES702_00349 [subsurface metagenome]